MTITYEKYENRAGYRRDEDLNKQIISLARRHKFYYENIKYGVMGMGNSIWNVNKPFQILLCIKYGRKHRKVLGFMIYSVNRLQKCNERMLNELEYWLVDDKYRGQGIGKTLYEKMVDDCGTMDIKNMSVMFKKDNMKLCNLYSSLGYKFVSTYDGVDTQECMNGQTDHNKWYRIEFREFIVPYKKDYRIIVLVKD